MRMRLGEVLGPEAEQELVGARQRVVTGGAGRRQREADAIGEADLEPATKRVAGLW
jgi:hypothetical protein